MKNTENLSGNSAALKKMCSDFVGIGFFSLLFQPFITSAINLGAKKVAGGLSYPEGMRELLQSSLGTVAKQGLATFKRRVVASMIPATVSNSLAEKYGLSSAQMVAMNTAFESAVASMLFRESSERFNAVNSKSFPIVNSSSIGVDLTQITKESFLKCIANSDRTAGFGEKDWDVLKGRLDRYKANFTHQFVTLVLRNGVFSAAAFGARPMAQAFVEDRGTELQKITGLESAGIETLATYSIRAALACATTPLDRAFTLFSSGALSAKEVNEKILGEIKSGNVAKLFKGAGARTVLCLLTASSISDGRLVGDAMRKWLEEQDFRDLSKFLSLADKKEDVAAIVADVDPAKVSKAIKDGGMNIGEVSACDVAQTTERARASCDAVSSEMAAALQKEMVPESSAKAAKAKPLSPRQKTVTAA